MIEPLASLLADGVIEEVLARLKSGKEADLWLVRHGGEIAAAKVYKARQARSFRNNASYKEGRQVRDTRTQRAMDRGSRFGQAAAEEAWKAKEADALHTLHAAGVRVPKPLMFYEGVLLMEVVVDAGGHPAPRLIDGHLAREQAAALYADLRGQAVRMLHCDVIHGDLSPYNVLLGWNGPVVIDFPQAVGAAHNSQAEAFFVRDLENVRRFLAALDPALHGCSRDAREIWRAYVRRELSPEFVPTGRSPEPPRAPTHAPRVERASPSRSGATSLPAAGGGAGRGQHAMRGDRGGTTRPGAHHGKEHAAPAGAHRAGEPAAPAGAHHAKAHALPSGPHHAHERAAPHGAAPAGERSGEAPRRRRRRRRRRSSGHKLSTP